MRSTPRARWQASLAGAGSCLVGWRVGGTTGVAIAGAGVTLALLAWLVPAAYAPIQRGLDAMTRALLAVFTWLALGLVYFGVFTPLRAWRTLRRRQAADLRPDPGARSYLRPLPPSPKDRFLRQF